MTDPQVLEILWYTLKESSRICQWLTGVDGAIACALVSDTLCQLLVPHDVPDELRNAILQHEFKHCSGWKHD